MPSTPQPARPLGGYALTSFKEAGGEETLRFEAVLTKDGKKIAHVANSGTGGSHRYYPIADGTAGWEALRAFEAYATDWNRGNELAGCEDNDQLVNHLVEVLRFNRMRALPFVLDDTDPWAGGEVFTIRGASRDEALGILRGPEFAERRPRTWDRATQDFVPLD